VKDYTDEELFKSLYSKENKYFMNKNGVYWGRQILFDIIEEIVNEILLENAEGESK
jgi:hypothetical protein